MGIPMPLVLYAFGPGYDHPGHKLNRPGTVAALAITGGAIGVGLQRIGSNLVSGIYLLITKPVRPGP